MDGLNETDVPVLDEDNHVLWPIVADRVAVSAGADGHLVHASVGTASEVWQTTDNVPALCGADDCLPVAHVFRGRPGSVLIATWPAPLRLRCAVCADLDGIGGRHRKGSKHWQKLIGGET